MLLPGTDVRASGPTGLYVLVEEVVLEPAGAKEPERIKIRGVFMNELDSGDQQHAARKPKQGWMTFKLTRGKEDLCRLEWKDVKALAGQNKVVAFGSAHTPYLDKYRVEVAVHPKPAAEPLEYPVDHGMYLLRPDSEPARKLKDFRKVAAISP
jgi:hypothetical protein